MHSVIFPNFKETKKRERTRNQCSGLSFCIFSERTPHFSLNLLEIRPSEFVGTRRKVALRDEAYAWAPNLKSFNKLLEVGVSPYLGFILYLSTLLMFELNEAVRGCLTSPKSWDRIV